jgi:autotransporter-associated beta strand protein
VGSTYNVTVADAVSTDGLTFNDVLVTLGASGSGAITLTGTTPTISMPGVGNQAAITVPLAGVNGFTYTGGANLTTLVLGGVNTYAGPTTVTLGTLKIQASTPNVIPDTSVLQLGQDSPNPIGNFDLNNNTETIKSFGHKTGDPGSAGGRGGIALGSGTLTLLDDGESRTYFPNTTGSALTGTGKLIKSGDGTLRFDGSANAGSAYNGEIVLNKGIIEFAQSNNLGSSFTAKLTLNGGTVHHVANSLSFFKDLEMGGDFTIDLGNGTAGDLQLNGGSDVANINSIVFKTSPQITVTPPDGTNRNAGAFLLRGAISDGGNNYGFTKLGTGVMAISSDASTFTGPVTIKEGIIRMSNPSGGAAGSTAKIGNGTNRINLAGGGLATVAPVTTVAGERKGTVDNPVNVTASSSISWMAANSFGSTTDNFFDFLFTSNNITLDVDNTGACPTSAACTLTFRNDTVNGSNSNNKVYRPTFTGNFTYGGDVVISNFTGVVQGLTPNSTRVTQFVGSNTGTQTWSGSISGDGAYRRGATGTTKLTGDVSLLYAGTSSNLPAGNTFTIDATGTLQIGDGGSTGAITGAANMTNNGHLVFNRTGTSSYSGAMSGTGDLNVSGGGTFTLSGTGSSFSGGTSINSSSILLVTGTFTSASNGVLVNSGTTLGGTGSIAGAITNNGTIAPGTSVGTLTTGAVTMGNNSHLAIELSGATPDLLAVNGALDLSSASDVLDISGTPSGSGPWLFATYTGSLGGNVFNTVNGLTGPLAGYTVDYSTSGQIKLLAPPGANGDWNGDTKVNAADYVTWRKNPAGNGNDPGGYVLWRENFSQSAGSGSGLQGAAAVPEPATVSLVLLTMGWAFVVLRRVNRRQ